jgi:hypothetical protein
MPKAAPKLRPFCTDWSCPSLWSCARAWGRSEQYWRFDPEADLAEGVSWYTGPRNKQRAACEDYERDKPREWLKDAFKPMGPAMQRPDIPADFKLHSVKFDCDGEG